MHRLPVVLALAFLVAACDPIVRATLLLAPAPARQRDLVRTPSDSAPAIPAPVVLEAVERVAGRFGLKALPPGRCPHAWEGPGLSGRTQFLNICAAVLPSGDVQLWITEGLTTRWTVHGDSLRRALADTLAQFGSVQTVAVP